MKFLFAVTLFTIIASADAAEERALGKKRHVQYTAVSHSKEPTYINTKTYVAPPVQKKQSYVLEKVPVVSKKYETVAVPKYPSVSKKQVPVAMPSKKGYQPSKKPIVYTVPATKKSTPVSYEKGKRPPTVYHVPEPVFSSKKHPIPAPTKKSYSYPYGNVVRNLRHKLRSYTPSKGKAIPISKGKTHAPVVTKTSYVASKKVVPVVSKKSYHPTVSKGKSAYYKYY